jgi:hypothetical protein
MDIEIAESNNKLMTDLPGQGELPFIGAKRCEKLK